MEYSGSNPDALLIREKKMSKKWMLVATNSLESWEPEYTISNFKEKTKSYWEKRYKAFKMGMRIENMKIQKPKKKYKETKASEEE